MRAVVENDEEISAILVKTTRMKLYSRRELMASDGQLEAVVELLLMERK